MTMTEIVELAEQPTAVVHQRLATSSLQAFFGRVFTEVAAELTRQGRAPAGPPFALFRGRPTDVVDVEAGFPVAAPIHADGEVTPSRLPGGGAVQTMHLGPYDRLATTYQVAREAITAAGHEPADLMWETYLSGPDEDPQLTQTLVTWPFTQ